jgi:GTP-binding protein
VLVANKVDVAKWEEHTVDFYRLGMDAPVSISAYHNRGIETLRKAVLERLPDLPASTPRMESLKLAIVGRPNVGKSTLLNALLGEERAIVDAIPGTTRDSIDAAFNWDGKEISLVDTAGIRRRGRVKENVEYYSLLRSLQAIDRCDIALLMIDAAEPVALQDLHIAGYVLESGKGVLILVNKWDTILREHREEYRRCLKQKLHFMSYVPVVYISAMSGSGTGKILPAAWEVWQERSKRLPEEEVSLAVKKAVEENPPSPIGLRRLHILRAYQHRTKPVTFVLQVNDPKLVHFSYQRYLANKLRHYFGFRSSPVQLVFARTVTKPERATRR